MIKLSLLVMAGLTVLFAIGLRWREERVSADKPPTPRVARPGFLATQRRRFDRWVTAAALAALATMLVLGGLNWARIWQGS